MDEFISVQVDNMIDTVASLATKQPEKCYIYIQSTLVISNSKGRTETFRHIRTSTYQS